MKHLVPLCLLAVGATGDLCRPAGGGDAEAEALFRRFSEAVFRAKSVQIRCGARVKTEGLEADISASLRCKEGNKLRLVINTRGTKEGQDYAYAITIVSDGRAIRVRENGDAWADYATPSQWNETVLRDIVRGGFPTGLELDWIKGKDSGRTEPARIGLRRMPEPTDFSLWRREEVSGREAVPVEFKLKSDSAFFKENAVILWVDASSGLPLKRMNVIQGDRTARVTETYDRFVLDERLEDSLFDLPKE